MAYRSSKYYSKIWNRKKEFWQNVSTQKNYFTILSNGLKLGAILCMFTSISIFHYDIKRLIFYKSLFIPYYVEMSEMA